MNFMALVVGAMPPLPPPPLEIANSTFINTELWINYMNTNVKLHNNVIDSSRVIINTIHSNVIIRGEKIFDLCYEVK
jgi:hypothetical protein